MICIREGEYVNFVKIYRKSLFLSKLYMMSSLRIKYSRIFSKPFETQFVLFELNHRVEYRNTDSKESVYDKN